MNKKINDTLVIGFALFAMFFGAGNLIFPPSLGMLSGAKWLTSLLGFLVTGVGFPILGIIAMGKCNGDLSKFTENINKTFGVFFITFIILIIGPLFALPRTAATTYEIAVLPMGIKINSYISSFIFFAIALFFVLKPNNVVDRIGKFLTPALILVLILLVVKNIFTPMGSPTQTDMSRVFLTSFKEGYQTMDALASVIFATIIIASITNKGYTEKKSFLQIAIFTGILAGLGLALVYGGLIFLGASAGPTLNTDVSRTEILVRSSEILWGNAGKIVLGLSMGLACLTTAIGLIATAGKYFSNMFKKWVSYRTTVIIISIVSFFLANFGVDMIITIAWPILEVVYPVTIVLIVMNLFNDSIPNRYFYGGAVIGTLCVSILQGLVAATGLINTILANIGSASTVKFEGLVKLLKAMPFENIGFPWLLPAIVVSILWGIIGYKIHKKA